MAKSWRVAVTLRNREEFTGIEHETKRAAVRQAADVALGESAPVIDLGESTYVRGADVVGIWVEEINKA